MLQAAQLNKTTLKITSKGQVTLRKEVLEQLGVRPGDRIVLEFVGPHRMEVRPAERTATLEKFVGCLKKPEEPAFSIEQLNEFARKSWAGEK